MSDIIVEVPTLENIHGKLNYKDFSFPCLVGKNGSILEQEKMEGDGKTPLGIYSIEKVFSYYNASYWGIKNFPFLLSTNHNFCVDDFQSKFYNQIVNDLEVEKDWNTAEEMKRKDHQYELGLTINHNFNCQKNAGSCIFIHIQRTANEGTAGCIALSLEDLKKLILALDESGDRILEIKVRE